MEDLDNKWILQGGDKCDNKNEKFPATLGLKNMAGVFILVGAGIVGGIGLIIIEIIYKKHQTRKQRRMEAARNCADKWRGTVEKRKTLRATLLNQKRPKSNGMEAFTVERGMRGLMTMTSTTTTTITTTVTNVDPPPPPPPPRTVPPSGILPSILTVDIPPNEPDPDIHNIPPPPPPPSSSPAIRLRGRRVVYASRNHPEYSAHDATV
ncbi:formin-like protein 3 [Centruroides sculpturatus]|nr:formin-like protein 3 [Centruroides sculpturatus]